MPTTPRSSPHRIAALTDQGPSDLLRRCLERVSRRVLGKKQEIEQLLIAFLVQGNCLLEGDAGMGKSLLAEQFAACLGLHYQRVALSPDLEMSELVDQLDRDANEPTTFAANVLLVEGIDYASPKLQTMLVDLPSRRVIRAGRESFQFRRPLMLLASHDLLNAAPLRLRSSQADQFLFEIPFGYPKYEVEYGIVDASLPTTAQAEPPIDIDPTSVRLAIQAMQVPPPIVHYALRLVRSTRVYEGEDHDFVLEFVQHGAGLRAAESLVLAAKARAVMHDRAVPTADDVRSLVRVVLRHRIVLNANAAKNGVTVDPLLDRLLAETPERVPGDDAPPGGYRQNDRASWHDQPHQ